MKDCKDFQEKLTAYIDEYLQPQEKAEVEEHLKNCPQCQDELEELQYTVSLLTELQEEEFTPPASFRRELRQKLENTSEAKNNKKVKKGFSINQVPGWMPLVAAALVLLIITPFALGIGYFNMGGMKSSNDSAGLMNTAPQDAGDFTLSMEESMPGERREFTAAGQEDGRMGIMEYKEAEAPSTEAIEQRIIKTGYLNIEVDSYMDTTRTTKEWVQGWGGYVVNENSYTFGPNQNLLAGNLAIRIPQVVFEEALDSIEELGNVRNRSATGQDVTEEYVDIQSRLRTMKHKEERLLELLAQSGSLGDVLAVENELANTRAELESLEGRLRYLSNRTDYSTINIELRETLTPTKQISTSGFSGILARAQESFIRSINTIIISVGNLLVFAFGKLPYIVIGLGVLGGAWIVVRKYKK